MGDQRHTSAALLPRNTPGTDCAGGWVGSKASVDGYGKSGPPGFELRTVQPIAIRHSGYAITAA